MGEPELQPTSYLTLVAGTPVVDRFGQPVGPVERVLLHPGGSFDGVIVGTRVGRRFVDAPEVRRVSARVVALGIALGDVEGPAPGRSVARKGVPGARYGRTEVTEADRDAAIDLMKRAFVREELTADELGQRVETAHVAATLDQLDVAIVGLTIG